MKKLSALILAFGFVVSAQAANYDSQYNNYYSANDQFISDQEIAKKVNDTLSAGWFSKGYDQVSAQVNNGEVLLQGSVPTLNDKNKLEKQIRNIDGVRSLNSQLEIQNSDPNAKDSSQSMQDQKNQFPQDTFATQADKQLNMKIRDNISVGYLWNSYKDVRLNTSNGVVTLEGLVDAPKDQQSLINAIRNIDGVKSVRSNLNFKNQQ